MSLADQLPSPNEAGYAGQQSQTSGNDDVNAHSFLVRQILGRIATTTVVKVVAVSNDGGLSRVGTVDVQPMVSQTDIDGNSVPHGTIFDLPYCRIQGGTDAVIIDPKVGDIGAAIFCMRDISSVKANRDVSNPGSFRRFDWADGLYIGGFLNGIPEQYVRFAEDGIHITSPSAVFIDAPIANFTGDIHAQGEIIRGFGGGDQVALGTHKHPTAAAGAPSSPTPGT